jgi:ABC-type protease/lipase transport system fused ATPase/permease subunit
MVVISHRMSAVSTCDQVLLLDAGRLTMHGTYSDVLRRHPASA